MADYQQKRRYSTVFAACIALVTLMASCNKDEEIIVEIPEEQTEFTVIEYLPGPGQFINEKVSGFDGVTTMEEACRYAQKRMEKFNYVSLGAYGGFITVKAQSPIHNTGSYDFSIAGNAIDTSSEPGIVWVMQDTNGNGLADDTWYELKGSRYDGEGYERGYSVTYYRPESQQSAVRWTDSNGDSGEVAWLGTYHKQEFYYPLWVREDSYTLSGSRLPNISIQDSATGEWHLLPFEWGYVDNLGEDSTTVELNGVKVQKNFFRISDAVTSLGRPAHLEQIDFIKVQTAVNAFAGIIGENSTEVCGFFRE